MHGSKKSQSYSRDVVTTYLKAKNGSTARAKPGAGSMSSTGAGSMVAPMDIDAMVSRAVLAALGT